METWIIYHQADPDLPLHQHNREDVQWIAEVASLDIAMQICSLLAQFALTDGQYDTMRRDYYEAIIWVSEHADN